MFLFTFSHLQENISILTKNKTELVQCITNKMNYNIGRYDKSLVVKFQHNLIFWIIQDLFCTRLSLWICGFI